MKYVTIRNLILHYKRKNRLQGKPSQKKAIKFLMDMAEKYGDTTAIYDEKELRHQSAQAIARRLGLPARVVLVKMEIAERYTKSYYQGNKL